MRKSNQYVYESQIYCFIKRNTVDNFLCIKRNAFIYTILKKQFKAQRL